MNNLYSQNLPVIGKMLVPLGWYPSCFTLPRSPLKGDIPKKYHYIRCIRGWLSRGPHPKGTSIFPMNLRARFSIRLGRWGADCGGQMVIFLDWLLNWWCFLWISTMINCIIKAPFFGIMFFGTFFRGIKQTHPIFWVGFGVQSLLETAIYHGDFYWPRVQGRIIWTYLFVRHLGGKNDK